MDTTGVGTGAGATRTGFGGIVDTTGVGTGAGATGTGFGGIVDAAGAGRGTATGVGGIRATSLRTTMVPLFPARGWRLDTRSRLSFSIVFASFPASIPART